jgi:hypothetical protein
MTSTSPSKKNTWLSGSAEHLKLEGEYCYKVTPEAGKTKLIAEILRNCGKDYLIPKSKAVIVDEWIDRRDEGVEYQLVDVPIGEGKSSPGLVRKDDVILLDDLGKKSESTDLLVEFMPTFNGGSTLIELDAWASSQGHSDSGFGVQFGSGDSDEDLSSYDSGGDDGRVLDDSGYSQFPADGLVCFGDVADSDEWSDDSLDSDSPSTGSFDVKVDGKDYSLKVTGDDGHLSCSKDPEHLEVIWDQQLETWEQESLFPFVQCGKKDGPDLGACFELKAGVPKGQRAFVRYSSVQKVFSPKDGPLGVKREGGMYELVKKGKTYRVVGKNIPAVKAHYVKKFTRFEKKDKVLNALSDKPKAQQFRAAVSTSDLIEAIVFSLLFRLQDGKCQSLDEANYLFVGNPAEKNGLRIKMIDFENAFSESTDSKPKELYRNGQHAIRCALLAFPKATQLSSEECGYTLELLKNIQSQKKPIMSALQRAKEAKVLTTAQVAGVRDVLDKFKSFVTKYEGAKASQARFNLQDLAFHVFEDFGRWWRTVSPELPRRGPKDLDEAELRQKLSRDSQVAECLGLMTRGELLKVFNHWGSPPRDQAILEKLGQSSQ